MLRWPSLAGIQLSPVAPRSWVLPSGHTPWNRHDRRAKPGEGIRCCKKGDHQLCDKHRGTSLQNLAGKIFARILLNRLNGPLEQGLLPKSQCGFRRHRGTTYMVFAPRRFQEKCQEMRTNLCTFVDLKKAFDTVNRDGLWKVMQNFGCPEQFTHMVRQLHDGMTASVTDNGTVSKAFAVTNENSKAVYGPHPVQSHVLCYADGRLP
ncbi:unnamed protein product [Schistocephalus solidus]|uniref:Reverse transcriptase domain-containing protein n=1 Tax=Schistocephalus solidus TaxID=70667 RepID=A0A183SZ27_SCHSO|nr:unnamed protein product [Schistocephalus solidus]